MLSGPSEARPEHDALGPRQERSTAYSLPSVYQVRSIETARISPPMTAIASPRSSLSNLMAERSVMISACSSTVCTPIPAPSS